MPQFIVVLGKVGRIEATGLVVYRPGDKIELTVESAIGLGEKVKPADHETAHLIASALHAPAAAQSASDHEVIVPPLTPPGAQQSPGKSRPLPDGATKSTRRKSR